MVVINQTESTIEGCAKYTMLCKADPEHPIHKSFRITRTCAQISQNMQSHLHKSPSANLKPENEASVEVPRTLVSPRPTPRTSQAP